MCVKNWFQGGSHTTELRVSSECGMVCFGSRLESFHLVQSALWHCHQLQDLWCKGGCCMNDLINHGPGIRTEHGLKSLSPNPQDAKKLISQLIKLDPEHRYTSKQAQSKDQLVGCRRTFSSEIPCL